MTRMDELKPTKLLARTLVIGLAKSGKTHWISQAAAAGFNLLYLDGDVSMQTIVNGAAGHLDKVYHLDCHDTMEAPRFGRIVRKFVQERTMTWNDSQQRLWMPGLKVNEAEEYWEITPMALDHTWIVVVDSWSALCWSWKRDWAEDAGVNLADLELGQDSRGMYGAVGVTANAVLHSLACLPCHLCMIAHVDEYVKYKNKPGKVKQTQKDQEIEWSRLVPLSVSKPHGMQIAKHFTDVLWMEAGHAGIRTIDGGTSPEKESGSRFERKASSLEHSFAALVAAMGGAVGGPTTNAGISIHRAGEFTPITGSNKILQAGDQAPNGRKTLADLLPKKAG